MVSALASHDNHFHQNEIIIFFYFLVFPFYFSQFWSKTMCKYILKVRQYWICNGKEVKHLYFFKMANTRHKGKTRHIAWLSSFLFNAHCIYRDEDDLAPDDKYYIKSKKERFVVLATFWKNDNSSCFWYTNSFNWKSSFIIKVRMDTPIFLFSYLLLIALYANSTYIIWLKKYSVVFYFLNF